MEHLGHQIWQAQLGLDFRMNSSIPFKLPSLRKMSSIAGVVELRLMMEMSGWMRSLIGVMIELKMALRTRYLTRCSHRSRLPLRISCRRTPSYVRSATDKSRMQTWMEKATIQPRSSTKTRCLCFLSQSSQGIIPSLEPIHQLSIACTDYITF